MIRLSTLEDLESVVSIEQQFGEEAFTKSSLRRFILNDRLLVYCEDQIVGYAIVLLRSNSLKARLYSIAVDKKHHRKGYGSLILKTIEQWVLNKGKAAITLEVASKNTPAQLLYQTFGYQPIGQIDNYYNNGDSAIKMTKNIVNCS